MPSCQLSSSPPSIIEVVVPSIAPPNTNNHHNNHHRRSTILPPIIRVSAAVSILLFLAVLYRKLTRKRTAPADLRRATCSFSASNRFGQGGFGSVYKGILKSGQEIAVKLMNSGSLQGEREFQNELSLACKIESDFVVSLIGFSSNPKRRRMLLVYELMHNRSLQNALLDKKCSELMEWKKRFAIALDIAKGLQFLHTECDPPRIHGDIKPSNILLDSNFNAKIAEFGLARTKIEDEVIVVEVDEDERKNGNGNGNGINMKKMEVSEGSQPSDLI